MEKPLEILVIEHNESHLNDIKTMLEARQKAGVNIKATYVSTLEEANAKMPDTDGVISSVFVQLYQGKLFDLGSTILRKALTLGKPVIFCTDEKYKGHGLPTMITKKNLHLFPSRSICGDTYYYNIDLYLGVIDKAFRQNNSVIKNWPRAYYNLMQKIKPEEANDFKKFIFDTVGEPETDNVIKGYYGYPSYETLSKIIKGCRN